MYLLILLNVTFYFLFKKKSLLEKLLQIINIDKRKFWTICLVREAYLVVAPTALNNTRLCSALPKISPISSFRAFSNLYPISKPNNQLCPNGPSTYFPCAQHLQDCCQPTEPHLAHPYSALNQIATPQPNLVTACFCEIGPLAKPHFHQGPTSSLALHQHCSWLAQLAAHLFATKLLPLQNGPVGPLIGQRSCSLAASTSTTALVYFYENCGYFL